MGDFAAPVLTAALAWWATTGLIMYLDGLRPSTFRWSMAYCTLGMFAAVKVISATSHDATPYGAYCGFGAALMVWAWLEMSFLMGFVTGPRRTGCTPGASTWRRFREATGAIAYHEAAIAIASTLVILATWTAPNPMAGWTIAVLWAMRLSAKLNLFLGVRNLGIEYLPPHLRYLAGYFARRPMNALFPVSVTAATLVLAWIIEDVRTLRGDAFGVTSHALLATLMALAIFEHWVMVLPFPTTALWSLGLASHRQASEPAKDGIADTTA